MRKVSQEAIRSLIMIEGMPNLFTLGWKRSPDGWRSIPGLITW